MEIGSGIAIAGTGFSVMGIAITAIRSIWQSKGTRDNIKNGNGNHFEFNKEACDAKHEAIRSQYIGINDWMNKIDDKVDRLLSR